ncbi:hypothetical protein KQX54_018165 [Cotesia glomerata]|uniref:Uncharacterized protein n=1 Tax=Cotesia glomerata TaxID=32391 RepID=A0AAV7ITD6_COTGL|nr:hypothetical protein KQX54_018165 [Cotesia glomerata]
MIPPEKQLLITIWKIATPDSYRYNGLVQVYSPLRLYVDSLLGFTCRQVLSQAYNILRSTFILNDKFKNIPE